MSQKNKSSVVSYKDLCAISCLNVSRNLPSIYSLLSQLNDSDLLDMWRSLVRSVSEFREILDERVSRDLPF